MASFFIAIVLVGFYTNLVTAAQGFGGGYSNPHNDYGYQTRNTYTPQQSHQPSYGYGNPQHYGDSYGHRGGYPEPIHNRYHSQNDGGYGGYGGYGGGYQKHNDYGYQTRNTYDHGHMNRGFRGVHYAKESLSNGKYEEYKTTTNDPCRYKPSGDYSLEGLFAQKFPGIDAQCNFVKCTNYKAYVSPCATGTKNNAYGRAHRKYGFCYVQDTSKYCGTPAPYPFDVSY